MTRTSQVKRDARIGEAEARRDAGIKVNHSARARLCRTTSTRKSRRKFLTSWEKRVYAGELLANLDENSNLDGNS